MIPSMPCYREWRCSWTFVVAATAACVDAARCTAEEPTKPLAAVPRQRAAAYAVEATATGGARVLLYREPVAEYVVDRANKPFLWRPMGPTGKSMTRGFPMADLPGETADHVHQRGLTFAHQSVSGADSWGEDATYRTGTGNAEQLARLGAIRHRGYRVLAGGTTGVIHARN